MQIFCPEKLSSLILPTRPPQRRPVLDYSKRLHRKIRASAIKLGLGANVDEIIPTVPNKFL